MPTAFRLFARRCVADMQAYFAERSYIKRGWLELHDSGTNVRLLQAGKTCSHESETIAAADRPLKTSHRT